MKRSLKIHAPAKINLGLLITGIRSDGFHSIESVFSLITLSDELTVELETEGTGTTLHCSGIPSPENQSNLVWKAAELFRERTGLKGQITISLHKNIPSPGGLGGGSSDAAAVIKALGRLSATESGITGEELGSDVPFFLSGLGTALVKGRGENIQSINIPAFHSVLVDCGENIPTPEAYRLWDEEQEHLTNQGRINNYTALNCGVWHEGKPFPVNLDNHFLPVLARRFPGVKRAVEELGKTGTSRGLSGSGPVFFALFRTESAAKEAEEHLCGKYPWVFRCRSGHIGASSNG